MQSYLHVPPRSFQTIFSASTNKFIKESLQKEQFFNQLLDQLTNQLSPQEHEFLFTFILEERYGTREQKHQMRHKNKHNTRSRTDVFEGLNSIGSDVFSSHRKVSKQRSLPKPMEEPIPCRVDAPKTGTTSIHRYESHMTDDHVISEESLKRRSKKHKFKRIQFKDRDTNQSEIYRQKPRKRSSQLKSISRQKLCKNYSNQFIDSIFNTPDYRLEPMQTEHSFYDHFNPRSVQELAQSQKQNKYSTISSLRFRPSPRRSSNLKLHKRKF